MKCQKIPEFKIKSKNSDFQVKELFFLPEELPVKRSSYSYIEVEKENLTTFQLLEKLATFFCLSSEDISASGLKDEQAITRQIISVKFIITNTKINKINQKLLEKRSKIRLVRIVGYGKKPITPKMLHGNEFKICIRNLDSEIVGKLENLIVNHKYQDCINYYDEQRFGTPDSCFNTHLIGRYLISREWKKAFEEYIKSTNGGDERKRVEGTFSKSFSYEEAIMQIGERKRDFFISSYNSYLWNQELNNTISQLKRSRKVEFPHIGKLHIPSSKDNELSSILSTKSYALDWTNKKRICETKTRPVRIVAPVFFLNNVKDRIFPNKRALTISFALPTGSYATMFIKQLLLKSRDHLANQKNIEK